MEINLHRNIIIQNQAEKLAATESEMCFLRGQLKSMGIEQEVRVYNVQQVVTLSKFSK